MKKMLQTKENTFCKNTYVQKVHIGHIKMVAWVRKRSGMGMEKKD